MTPRTPLSRLAFEQLSLDLIYAQYMFEMNEHDRLRAENATIAEALAQREDELAAERRKNVALSVVLEVAREAIQDADGALIRLSKAMSNIPNT